MNYHLSKFPNIAQIRQIDLGALPMICRMEERGIRIDRGHFLELQRDLEKESIAIKGRIESILDPLPVPNLASPPAMAALLYRKLRVQGEQKVRFTKSGKWESTKEDDLVLFRKNHPIVDAILDWREVEKLKTTYAYSIPFYADSDDRVHTSLNYTRAASGRLTSSKPLNLQNVPIRGKWGQRVRNGFIASPGHSLVASDYSQIEFVWAAQFSQDPNLLSVYREGRDLHTNTAQLVFGIRDPAKVDPIRHRIPAKTVGFGVLYLMSAMGLQKSIADSAEEIWDLDECEKFINLFYQAYPGIRQYQEEQLYRIRRYGMVWTAFGRVRLIPEIRSALYWVREEAKRQAGNTPIQGSAQDTIKIGMALLDESTRYMREGGESQEILQIHDEVIAEVRDRSVEEYKELSIEALESAVELDVPVRVEAHVAGRWGELK